MMKKIFCMIGLLLLFLCGCTNQNNSTNPAGNSNNYKPTTIDSFNKKIETSKGYYRIDYLFVDSNQIIIGGLFCYTEIIDSFSLFYEITNDNDTKMIFDECVLLSSSSIIELNKEMYCYYNFNLTDEIINHRNRHAEDSSHFFDVLYCDFGMGGYIRENENEDYLSDYYSCFHCYLAPNINYFENGYYHN